MPRCNSDESDTGAVAMINARPAERPPLRASSPAEPCSAGAGFLQAVKAWWQSLWTTPHQDQPALPNKSWEDCQ